MRNLRRFRQAVAVVALLLSSPPEGGAGQGSTVAALRARFEAGQLPRAADLCGAWVLVTNASTARFLTGGDGPEHVLADPLGIRRDVGNQKVYEWHLTIERGVAEALRLKSASAWEPTGDTSDIEFGADAITFEKDYGGDSRWVDLLPSGVRGLGLPSRWARGWAWRRVSKSHAG